MEKFNVKRFGIVLAITAIIIVFIAFLFKSNKNENDYLKNYEDLTLKYFTTMTGDLNTQYGGIEALFATEETKLEDLNTREILHTATKYIDNETKNSNDDFKKIIKNYKAKYSDIEKSKLYKGEDVRNTIKLLFGINNFKNQTIEANEIYKTSFIYIHKEDIYMVKPGTTESTKDNNLSLDYSIIKTEEKNNELKIIVAVAYCKQENDQKTYAKDRLGQKIVIKNSEDFPKEKIDEFDKYEFTLSKSKEENNYTFKSIKKIKLYK